MRGAYEMGRPLGCLEVPSAVVAAVVAVSAARFDIVVSL